MRFFPDFERDETPFHEREGAPDEFRAAVGQVVLDFAYLEDNVRNVAAFLMGGEHEVTQIALAELPFRTKLDLLGSLARHRIAKADPDTLDEVAEDWLAELIKFCRKAEELRNTYLHSSYIGDLRAKTTAKAKRGLQENVEPVDAELILDVAYYISYAGMSVENVPLMLGLADLVTSSSGSITYSLGGKFVAKFESTNR